MRWAALAAAGLVLAGCSPDQGATLSCPGPDATGCDSLSTVYERTAGPAPADDREASVRRIRAQSAPPAPDLLPPQVVRVWLAPWEDEQGDLHDYQYLYLIIEQAQWSVDRRPRRRAQDAGQ